MSETELENFQNAMNLRQEADYAMTFSEEGALRVVGDSEDFIQVARKVLEKGGRRHEKRA